MYPTSQDWAQLGEPASTTLLNDFHTDVAETDAKGTPLSFPHFPRLPIEIAHSIWKQALQQHRLISITVSDTKWHPVWQTDHLQLEAKNGLGKVTSGKNYKLRVTTHHALTPLLRTNRESRKAALEFYRVHIPYDRVGYGEERCLYLSPEWDFVHVFVETKRHPEVFADFVHDLRAYDPRGVGVLNLGVGTPKPLELELPLDPLLLLAHVRRSFKAIISNLRLVFFQSVTTGDSRIMFDSLDCEEVRFNRSYPIHASTEAFDLVEPDPRPINADLDKVGLGLDPRSMPWLWKQMERKFGITHEPGTTRFVYHLAAPGFSEDQMTISRADATEMLRREHEEWRLHWKEGGFFGRNDYENPDTPEKLKNAPIPAFGFWMVPLDALGEIPEEEPRRWDMKRVVDLTEHRPQLGVFRLPRET